MDPVTHGLIGASASQLFAKKKEMRAAALVGAVGAMLPDLDILIDSANDPLLQLEFHRQFTHSFLFIPVIAFIATLVCWWFVKNRLTLQKAYIFGLMGALTAGLADTFTSYGVQLLWPFTDERFAWNIISVFDPLFSLGLVIALGLALYKKDRIFILAGFGWMTFYLIFGFYQKENAKKTAFELAEQRNHNIEQLIVKPTIANQVLWSIRYVHTDTLYADGVRLLPFALPEVYKGESVELLKWKQEFALYRGTTLFNDISRFDQLSNGILVLHPNNNLVIGDGRYSMLPTSTKPLWGIEIDTTAPEQHADFKTYRETNPKIRSTFKNMLLGDHQ